MFNSSSYQKKLDALVRDENSNVLVIYGDHDEFTSVSKYRQWTEELGVRVVEIAGGTHFWQGRGKELKHSVIGWLS